MLCYYLFFLPIECLTLNLQKLFRIQWTIILVTRVLLQVAVWELQALFTPGHIPPVHSPPHHRRRCRHRRGGRGQERYIGRGRGRPGRHAAGPRRPWHGGSGPIHGRGGRGSWRSRLSGCPWGGSGQGPRRGGGHGVSGGSLSVR